MDMIDWFSPPSPQPTYPWQWGEGGVIRRRVMELGSSQSSHLTELFIDGWKGNIIDEENDEKKKRANDNCANF